LSSAALHEKATPAVAFCFVLNRLLEREAWARERLAPFAGAAVELRVPVLPPLRFTILQGGRVEAGGGEPRLTARLKEDLRGIEYSGDEKLAAEADLLVRNLRWDFEEDLSRVFGDVAAHRMAETARALGRWPLDAAGRLAEAFAAYAADESRVLLRRAELERHAARVVELRDALDRLAGRIGRL
jgi:ubiquinone biosynthesis protein UbiJ